MVFGILLFLGTSVSHANDSSDDAALIELQSQKEKFKSAYDTFNQSNPLSEQYKKNLDPNAPQPAFLKSSSWKTIEHTLNNPITQKMIQFITSPVYIEAIEEIAKSPFRQAILISEGIWLVAIFLFRSWRKSKLSQKNWLRTAWLHLWTNGLYIAGAIGLIPIFFLGEPYRRILQSLYAAILR